MRSRACLASAGLVPRDVDHVVFYEKPFVKFERLLETYLAYAPRGFRSFSKALPIWLKDKLFQKTVLTRELVARARRRRRLGVAASLLRASPEPRGERLLPVAVRARRWC